VRRLRSCALPARRSEFRGPLRALKSASFPCGRLQNLRSFTDAAARLIAVVLKLKIGTYWSKTIRHENTFDIIGCWAAAL
jgi:hypothetical protein